MLTNSSSNKDDLSLVQISILVMIQLCESINSK